MKKYLVLVAIGLFAAACSAQAQFVGLSIGHHGVSVGIGASVCSAPPAVVAAPAPVYTPPVVYSAPAPQVYYSQPPVVYAPAPVCVPAPAYVPGYYGYGPTVIIGGGYGGWHHGYRGHWEHRGWHR